jgi:hypothetical protein
VVLETNVRSEVLLPLSPGHHDDGGSKHLRNVGHFLPVYTAQHLRRHSPLDTK